MKRIQFYSKDKCYMLECDYFDMIQYNYDDNCIRVSFKRGNVINTDYYHYITKLVVK